MVDLPKRKVGIVSCSGEELPEGTVTRLAALRVLEHLRPDDSVTICLPLFLAGGQGDRAFAKFYPTIAVDGCELRCAARATEMYSSKPAASIMIRDVIAENSLAQPEGRRRLNAAGLQAVEATAGKMAILVDELLAKGRNRQNGSFVNLPVLTPLTENGDEDGKEAACSCGSGIPVQKVQINGQEVTLIALPLIFEQFQMEGKALTKETGRELFEAVKIYNPVPDGDDERYQEALLQTYITFCTKEKTK
jgi:uncharacterized metal-binding protein